MVNIVKNCTDASLLHADNTNRHAALFRYSIIIINHVVPMRVQTCCDIVTFVVLFVRGVPFLRSFVNLFSRFNNKLLNVGNVSHAHRLATYSEASYFRKEFCMNNVFKRLTCRFSTGYVR